MPKAGADHLNPPHLSVGGGADTAFSTRATPPRSKNELDRTAIIVLTGLADRQTKVRAFAAGADDYIVKPFMPQDLLARLQGVLRARHSGGDDTVYAVPRSGAAMAIGAATASTTR